MSSLIICARRIKKGEFDAEPGKLRFLEAPTGQVYDPSHEIPVKEWVRKVQDLADGKADDRVSPVGDILIFVHGYNNTIENIALRQKLLERDLRAEGWKGVVVAFDWPSNDSTLNYLEDRWDAAETAMELITRGMRVIIEGQQQGCETRIHLVGHSTGAYVIMEAFAQTEKKGEWFQSDWRVGQVAFIGGDVSARSLDHDSDWARPMFRRIMRLTNYSNGYDHVLSISNVKRAGVAPRAGRVGITDDHHEKAVNVDCSAFFSELRPEDQPDQVGTWAHSWHIGNRAWARDLAMTLEGRIDRQWIPTRRSRDGRIVLIDAPRPAFEEAWLERADARH